MKIYLFLPLFLLAQTVMAQCHQDRHNTSLSSTWMSCEISANPNPFRGDSHWISYDLGEVKKLGTSHFWNINNPDELNSGARQIAIAISDDGQEWEDLTIWEAAIADGSGFYSGEQGYDFAGLETRFLLLTILNSHGGDCVGFSEIRVDIDAPSSLSDITGDEEGIMVFPNPAVDNTTVTFVSKSLGKGTLYMTDISGKVVLEKQLELQSGEQSILLSVQEVPSGQYLIRIINESNVLQTELSIINN